MPPEVNVATNPLIVYGMVAVFSVAIVLALVFARPRRGLGAVKRSEVPDQLSGGLPWMPGGDIRGNDPQPEPEPLPATDPWQPAIDPWQQPTADQWPAADPWQPAPPAAPPPTGAAGQSEPQPRWDKR
ncbi:MAG TPA: hypothetical protein VIF08_00410 [Candidatus Limnocylindrales bacterium]